MRILQIHNRYRSSSPGGEDRVVDQEGAALRARGHVVERFERFNDDIDQWSRSRRAVGAGAGRLEPVGTARARADDRRFRPDVVHVHNTFPLLSPSVLYACRDADVPVVVTLHNYRLTCRDGRSVPRRQGVPRVRRPVAGPAPSATAATGRRVATIPVADRVDRSLRRVADAAVGVRVHLRVAARHPRAAAAPGATASS